MHLRKALSLAQGFHFLSGILDQGWLKLIDIRYIVKARVGPLRLAIRYHKSQRPVCTPYLNMTIIGTP